MVRASSINTAFTVTVGLCLSNACLLYTSLNILSMRRLLPKPPAILPNLLRSFFAAAVMGVLAWGALWALKAVGVREIGTGRLILCAVPVLVGVVSYFFTAVKFKVITHEDCLLLPKGEKIAKILKL